MTRPFLRWSDTNDYQAPAGRYETLLSPTVGGGRATLRLAPNVRRIVLGDPRPGVLETYRQVVRRPDEVADALSELCWIGQSLSPRARRDHYADVRMELNRLIGLDEPTDADRLALASHFIYVDRSRRGGVPEFKGGLVASRCSTERTDIECRSVIKDCARVLDGAEFSDLGGIRDRLGPGALLVLDLRRPCVPEGYGGLMREALVSGAGALVFADAGDVPADASDGFESHIVGNHDGAHVEVLTLAGE